MQSETLTPEEAAEFLRVNPQTVYRALRAGTLPGAKIGTSWRILRSELEEHLRTGGLTKKRSGHLPGLVREALTDAFDQADNNIAWWETFTSPAHATKLLGRLWSCADAVPSHTREAAAEWLLYRDPWSPEADDIRQGCTYAELARALKPELEEAIKEKVSSSTP